MGFTKHVGAEIKGDLMEKLSRGEWIILVFGGFSFLGLSFFLQGVVCQINSFCEIDSSAYLRNGFLFYKYGSFSPVCVPQELPIFALGYPLIIGMLYKIFGPNVYVVIWAQVFISLVTAYLLFFAVRRLFGVRVACITYLLWMLNLGPLVFAHFILAETWLIFFLILFFERFSVFWVSGKKWALFGAAGALGVSVLMKAAALYLPVLFLGVLWFYYRGRWVIFFRASCGFILFFFIPIWAFMLHNKLVFNQFRLTYIDSFNTQVMFYSEVIAEDRGTSWPIEMQRLQERHGGNLDSVKQAFWTDVKNRPCRFAQVWLKNVLKIFAGLYSTSLKTLIDNTRGAPISYFSFLGSFWQRLCSYVQGRSPYPWVIWSSWFEVFYGFLRYICALLGIWFLWSNRQRLLLFFFLAYIFYFSFAIAFDGTARYRFFFEFVLIILAALGIQECITRLRVRRLSV